MHTFADMVDFARREGFAAFIIAGDLFDTERVTKKNLESILSLIERAPTVSFFYLRGNHEKDALIRSGAKFPKNLYFFEDGWTYFKAGDVTVAGRCETEEGMFDTLHTDDGGRTIVVLHGELRERSQAVGVIGRGEIGDKPIDYLALGHYHAYSEERLSPRCTAVYCGTPEGRGFDETGEHGFSVIECDKYSFSSRFVPIAKRRLHIAEVDLSGTNGDIEAEDKLIRELSKIPRTDLVRCIVKGERELTRSYNLEAFRQRLAGMFYYFEIKDESRLAIKAEDYRYDISLKGEFIRGVLADERLTEKQKEAVISLGISALMDEID
jgi:DNA repair exonuclease SbcCD nuclease subunit